ncbi:MAG: response regulator transcription factor [Chloroflexi bacterium]|nr:response regulator transcription factor [Chloroflexota bacterium]
MRVMVVDDHALFREGIVGLLKQQPDMEVVGEASDGLEALVLARNLKPDVILMDVTMPGTNGIQATRLIKQELPATNIIMLTVRDEDENLFEAIKSGAQGYLLKTIRAQQLIEMLRTAQSGEPAISPSLAARMIEEFRRLASSSLPLSPEEEKATELLTPREREVLALIARGASDREIAQALTLSLYTVKAHVRAVLQKLQVASRHDAARMARQSNAPKN